MNGQEECSRFFLKNWFREKLIERFTIIRKPRAATSRLSKRVMAAGSFSRILKFVYVVISFACALSLSSPLPIMKGCVYIATSVDGFIAEKDGNLDWLTSQPALEGEDFGYADFLKSIDVMIMGRNTFDVVTGFGKEAWSYGDLPVIVWTRNMESVNVPEWLPDTVSVRSAASPIELCEELEAKGEFKRAYIDGGKTVQMFLNAGLIHHMTLTRIPILLGDGIPLFSGSIESRQRVLKHVSTTPYPNGFVISKYDVP